MFVVFYGTDRTTVRDAATAYIEANLPPDGTLTTLEAAEYEPNRVADALGAQSLFGGSEWFLFDQPSLNEEFQTEVEAALAEMSESQNTFIVLEAGLLAAAKKRYEKHAAQVTEYKAGPAERFNSFALAEALAARDKRRLWVLLAEARLAGSREEEMVGILWWQLKALRLAAQTKSAAEAGMKDFPYNKAKRALPKFRAGEIEQLSASLLGLYHDGHAGVRDMDLALEQWVLEL